MSDLSMPPLFMHPPGSFGSLINRLGECSQNDIGPLYLTNVSNHRFSIEQILQAISFPLGSYHKLTSADIEVLKTTIARIFPSYSAREERILTVFLKNIPFITAPPLEIDPRTLVNFTHSPFRGDKLLGYFESSMKMDVKQRLDVILGGTGRNTGLLTADIKAKKLQQVLSLLLIENKFILSQLNGSDLRKKAFEYRALSKEGYQSIATAPEMESQNNIPDNEAFLDATTMTITLQAYGIQHRISAALNSNQTKMDSSMSQEVRQIIAKIVLLKDTSQPGTEERAAIEKCISSIRAQILQYDYIQAQSVFIGVAVQMFNNIRDSTLDQYFDEENDCLTDDFSRTFPNCIPFTEWVLRKEQKMQRISRSGTLNTFENGEIESALFGKTLPLYTLEGVRKNVNEMHLFCSKWLEIQDCQVALYKQAYQELDGLIKNNSRNAKNSSEKLKWYGYKKSVFGTKDNLPETLERAAASSFESMSPTYQSYFGVSKPKISLEASKATEPKKEIPKQKKPQQKHQPKHKTHNKNSSSSSSSQAESGSSTQKMTAEISQLALQETDGDDEPLNDSITVLQNVPEPVLAAMATIDPATIGVDPQFTLALRAQRWLDHPPGTKLKTPTFEETYVNKDQVYQNRMIEAHGLTRLIDRHCTIGNKLEYRGNTQYLVAAEMQRDGEDEVRRGVINWTIDARTNVCYHRFFHIKKDREILKLMMEQTFFQEEDFPSLADAMKVTPQKSKKVQQMGVKSEAIQIDKMFGNVTVYDPRLGLTITMFRSTLLL